MRNDEQHFRRLLQLWVEEKCTPQEATELMNYLQQSESNRMLLQEIRVQFDEQVLQNELPVPGTGITTPVIRGREKHFPIRFRFPAVAAALILLCTGTYLFFRYRNNTQKTTGTEQQALVKHDLGPGANKAILVLAGGEQVQLGNTNTDTLTPQGGVTIINKSGQLLYHKNTAAPAPIVYNTITVPCGGQYQLILADGSKVWLNAASSIRYPTAFSGRERKVAITGEVYFEVARNEAMPFKVEVAGKAEIEVLGTHFNINAYADEPSLNTTLLEGRVKITENLTRNTCVINPGEQASLSAAGKININRNINIDEVMAWKNGRFYFDNTGLTSILHQLERWYDATVVYRDAVPDGHYSGNIERNVNLTDVLKMLELTGNLRFTVEGKKLIVQLKQ